MPVQVIDEKKAQRPNARHTLVVDRRESVSITGVTDVISFDEETIIAETDMGILLIRGGNLHVNRLNLESGELAVDGMISSLSYEDRAGFNKGKSWLGRLFK